MTTLFPFSFPLATTATAATDFVIIGCAVTLGVVFGFLLSSLFTRSAIRRAWREADALHREQVRQMFGCSSERKTEAMMNFVHRHNDGSSIAN